MAGLVGNRLIKSQADDPMSPPMSNNLNINRKLTSLVVIKYLGNVFKSISFSSTSSTCFRSFL